MERFKSFIFIVSLFSSITFTFASIPPLNYSNTNFTTASDQTKEVYISKDNHQTQDDFSFVYLNLGYGTVNTNDITKDFSNSQTFQSNTQYLMDKVINEPDRVDFRRANAGESELLSSLKDGKTPEEQYRFDAAACTLLKCSDGVSKSDPNYETLKTLQEDGENYKDEQNEIRQISASIYLEEHKDITDDLQVDTPPFFYTPQDYVSDVIDANQLGTRASGVLQLTGGALDAVAGVGVCLGSLGTGCVGGAALWTIGWDNYFTGTQTLFSGEQHSTLGAQTLQSLGVPEQYSELVYAGVNLGAAGSVALRGVVDGVGSSVGTTVNVGDDVVKAGVKGGVDDVVGVGSKTRELYRAVTPEELVDIQTNNLFRNLGSAEGKYFTTSAEAASSYAKQAVYGFGDAPYTLIKTNAPLNTFDNLSPAIVDRGIPAWVIPNDKLPQLVPEILDTMPIPLKK